MNNEESLPRWPDGQLAKVLKDAELNVRRFSHNMPEVYGVLEETFSVLAEVQDILKNDNRDELLVPRMLSVRVYASIFAAIRLLEGCQGSETFPLIRMSIEQAWYALYIGKDPIQGDRARIWFERNESDDAKNRCRNEFTIKNLRQCHEKFDAQAARKLHAIYELTIDFGAHPNLMGIVAGIQNKTSSGNDRTFEVGILNPDPVLTVAAAWSVTGAAIGALRIFEILFPERFKLMSIDQRLERLTQSMNSVFSKYGIASATTLRR